MKIVISDKTKNGVRTIVSENTNRFSGIKTVSKRKYKVGWFWNTFISETKKSYDCGGNEILEGGMLRNENYNGGVPFSNPSIYA